MSVPSLYDLSIQTSLLDGLYPRICSQIDRDPNSPTYGSCDRGFWMYRLHDFDTGVQQQSALTFAYLTVLGETADFKGYSHLVGGDRKYWTDLALAINRRTLSVMGRSGLLDEYYPGERSFPGTVFAAYATLKSAVLLDQSEIIEHPATTSSTGC